MSTEELGVCCCLAMCCCLIWVGIVALLCVVALFGWEERKVREEANHDYDLFEEILLDQISNLNFTIQFESLKLKAMSVITSQCPDVTFCLDGYLFTG